MKRIKRSNRGLTFTLDDQSLIGSKFRYIVDKTKKEILIIPDERGTGTVSRKKSGHSSYKPLYDIRSKEVRDLVSSAEYMEIETVDDRIIVHTYQKIGMSQQIETSEVIRRDNIIRIEDVFAKKTGEIVLQRVSGDVYGQYSLFDNGYFEETINTIHGISGRNTNHVRKELHRVYDVVSLLSGAGLLDYSFRDPQFRFVYAVDFDKDACETYAENIGPIECRDIRDVKAKEIPEADVIIGGLCCQAYSCENRHMDNLNGIQGESKRLLLHDYSRLVREKFPQVFCIENVPQMLTAKQGLYIEKIIRELDMYEITCKIVSDCEHGGFSVRKRAIIIGSRIGKIELPDAEICPMRTVREALEKVDASWYNYTDVTVPREETRIAMSYVPQGGNWKDIPEAVHKFGPKTHSNTYRRLSLDALSPTIVNWRKCNLLHPTENRILTVSEAAAIMGLDKNFKVKGRSLNSRQQQISNGVTQAVGRFVKKYVLKALNAYNVVDATARFA